MIHKECRIISNQEIAPHIYEMIADTRDFPQSKPGQFAMLYLDKGETLLPRPISICRQSDNLMMFVYKTVGKGTEYLSKFKTDDIIRITAPLGNGFTFKDGLKKIALIGGGVGIPPMVSIYDSLKEYNIEIHVYLGFRDAHFLTNLFSGAKLRVAAENLDALKHPPHPAGEVYPKNANAVAVLSHFNEKYDEMYACGPKPMLAALSRYAAENNTPLQVSLEERMACGVGVCMGCVVPPDYLKICCNGPVFYSDKVVLD